MQISCHNLATVPITETIESSILGLCSDEDGNIGIGVGASAEPLRENIRYGAVVVRIVQ
jgi:hypothetical protein